MNKYFCKCGKQISRKHHLRCLECYLKTIKGKNHPNFKTGKYIENNCQKCGTKISSDANHCRSCSKKGELNSNYKIGKFFDNPNHCVDCKKEIDSTSIRCKKCAKKGKLHPLFGKERPDSRKRMIDNKLGYIHGRGYEPYTKEFTEKLKESIRARDNYQCQGENCSMTEEEHLIVYGRVLEIHHIDHNKQNCNEDNLITLCKQCNIRANKNIDYWQEFYNLKIKENIK